MFSKVLSYLRKKFSLKYKLLSASFPERADILRNQFFHLGVNVELHTLDFGTEPYLISIDDNVCIAAGVRFITHDVSCFRMARYLGIHTSNVDKVGCIVLKNNCFIGAYSILMPNVVVGKNSVVAAGSVVTKPIPDGEVWGGNPARFIMKTDEYAQKVLNMSKEYPWMEIRDYISEEELKVKRQEYFFNSPNC